MNIGSKSELANVRLMDIRDFIREYWVRGEFSTSDLMAHLNVDEESSCKIIEDLIEEGWVVQTEDDRFEPLENAIYLIQDKANKLIPRKKAERCFNAFMKRVEEVNGNPYYLLYVKKVISFGSFPSYASLVDGVDLAIEFDYKDVGKGVDIMEVVYKRSTTSGIQFSTIYDKLDFAYQEVRSFLKIKSRLLTFHSYEHPTLRLWPGVCVYECNRRPLVTIT
jgi:hypothetical protein